MLKIQRCIIEINYKVYLIRKPILEIAIRFHNFFCIFDWINTALLSRRDSLKKKKKNLTDPKNLSGSVYIYIYIYIYNLFSKIN